MFVPRQFAFRRSVPSKAGDMEFTKRIFARNLKKQLVCKCSSRGLNDVKIFAPSTFLHFKRRCLSSNQNSSLTTGARERIAFSHKTSSIVCSRKYSSEGNLEWTWKLSRFNSIILDLGAILNANTDRKMFPDQLAEHVKGWITEGRRGIWVKIPVEQSWVVADLYSANFKLHHAKHDYIMMKRWLLIDEDDKMPLYAFHTVGVSGLVLNEENGEALVVQDKGKTTMWKFPGGFSEPNEDIGETAVREVREETGIESEFKSLLTFRQQHRMGFDQSDLYFICHLSPLSFEITVCPNEIAKCQWIQLQQLRNLKDATPLTKLVSSLALQGLQNGFDDVSIKPQKMTSWVPPYDKTFQVFHRPLKE